MVTKHVPLYKPGQGPHFEKKETSTERTFIQVCMECGSTDPNPFVKTTTEGKIGYIHQKCFSLWTSRKNKAEHVDRMKKEALERFQKEKEAQEKEEERKA